MLQKSGQVLAARGIAHQLVKIDGAVTRLLPFSDNSFDVVISFYCFEHLAPLMEYTDDIRRVLKPGGLLVGAIPCEGGLLCGTGRYFTSRRYLLKNTGINPDKLICWETP